MATHKKQDQLTVADFNQFPIWKLLDPAKPDVEPVNKKGGAPLLSLVATECVAADGSVHPGFAILTKINLVAPVLFAGDTQIALYHGDTEPPAEFRASAYERLGKKSDELFPLRIRMTVTSQHRPLPAAFDGFVYRTKDGGFLAVR
jgi:hypothetical protein